MRRGLSRSVATMSIVHDLVDGGKNLLEFALHTAPLDPASRPTPGATLVGPHLVFTFTRPRQTLDLTYIVEESTTLNAWTPANAPLDIIQQTDADETIRVAIPASGEPPQFLRLRVVLAN